MVTMAIHHRISRAITVLIGGPTGGIATVLRVTGIIIIAVIRRVTPGIIVITTPQMKRTRYTVVQGTVISAETTACQLGAMSRLHHPVIPVIGVWS